MRLLTAIEFLAGLATLIVFLLGSNMAFAAAPLDRSVSGITLGMSPERASEVLTQRYPDCVLRTSYFKEANGVVSDFLSELELDAAERKAGQHVCAAQVEVAEHYSLKFVNAETDPLRPLYQVTLRRQFPEPSGHIQYGFEALRKELLAQYGPPSGQLRMRTSALPRKKGKRASQPSLPESYNVVYVWGGKGLRAEPFAFCMDNCGAWYLTADISIARRKGLLPRDVYYVQALALRMTDQVLDEQQFDWVYARSAPDKLKGKVY